MKHQSIEYKGYTIEVHHDEDGESPRDWCPAGVILTWDRDGIGDENIRPDDFDPDEIIEEHGSIEQWLRDRHGAVGPVLPVFLMDHSGRTLRCDPSGFQAADSHGWDWGQIGYTFATAKTLEVTGIKPEGIEKALAGDLAVYNQYLEGEVYGYVVSGPDGEEIDSLWGIYDDEYNSSNDDVTHCHLLRTVSEEIDRRIETLAAQEVTDYRVDWSLRVEANNPADAAHAALLAQRDSAGRAFKVVGPDGHTTLIDTDDLEVN